MKTISFLLLIIFQISSLSYYEILSVPKDADDKTIKKAFKKASLLHHPDRGEMRSQDTYMKISLAYEVLMNPAKREIYDRYGEDGINNPWMHNAEEIYNNYFGQKNQRFKYMPDFFYANSSAIEITEDNSSKFYGRKDIWFVQFYGPRSLSCREISGDWKALAKRFDGIVNVAAVNCDEVPDICREMNVRKYPLIAYFHENTQLDFEVYSGPKSFRGLFEFVQGKISGFLRTVTIRDYQEFIKGNEQLCKILAFTNTKENLPLVRTLSKIYKGRAIFGEAKASDKDLVALIGVKEYPALVRIEGNTFEIYSGELEKLSVQKWINEKVPKEVVKILAKELNKALYLVGNCNENDSFTCVIATDPDSQGIVVLNDIADKFAGDQVKVFWVVSEKYERVANKIGGISVVKGKNKKIIQIDCLITDLDCIDLELTETLSGKKDFEDFDQLNFGEIKKDL